MNYTKLPSLAAIAVAAIATTGCGATTGSRGAMQGSTVLTGTSTRAIAHSFTQVKAAVRREMESKNKLPPAQTEQEHELRDAAAHGIVCKDYAERLTGQKANSFELGHTFHAQGAWVEEIPECPAGASPYDGMIRALNIHYNTGNLMDKVTTSPQKAAILLLNVEAKADGLAHQNATTGLTRNEAIAFNRAVDTHKIVTYTIRQIGTQPEILPEMRPEHANNSSR